MTRHYIDSNVYIASFSSASDMIPRNQVGAEMAIMKQPLIRHPKNTQHRCDGAGSTMSYHMCQRTVKLNAGC